VSVNRILAIPQVPTVRVLQTACLAALPILFNRTGKRQFPEIGKRLDYCRGKRGKLSRACAATSSPEL
jgi:hypothetical protein